MRILSKLYLTTLCFTLVCGQAFALNFTNSKVGNVSKSFVVQSNATDRILAIDAGTTATFIKDYRNTTSVNADYSVGLGTGTFTRTGGATKPATYIDQDGVIQVDIASNTPRFTAGYYGTSGFVGQPGLIIEGSSTNDLSKSEEFEHGDWTKTNTTADDTDSGSTAPDGATQTSSLTATAGNGTLVQSFVDAGANVYTASVWVKRKTGTGTINLRANSGDGYTAITVTSDWTRHQVKSSALANPDFDLQIVTNTDAIYIYGAQLENVPFATTYIPTTTAGLTRNAEKLTYPIASNRTAATESCVVRVAPDFPNGVVLFGAFIGTTDTKDRRFNFEATSNNVKIVPNNTDDIGSAIASLVGEAWTANTELTLGYSVQATGNPNAAGYFNGAADGTDTNTDFTANAWGTNFYVGSKNDGSLPLYGVIQSIVYLSDFKSAADHAILTNALDGGI